MSRIDCIFFDLDGTLTDPWVGITRCIRHALERVGVDAPPAEDLTWCIGPPLKESLESLLGDGAAVETALKHFRARFVETGLYENQLYDGVPEALSLLASKGVALYVATSKPEVYATRIVDHFGIAGFFGGVFGATLDGERTAKADLLRWALGESGGERRCRGDGRRPRSRHARCGGQWHALGRGPVRLRAARGAGGVRGAASAGQSKRVRPDSGGLLASGSGPLGSANSALTSTPDSVSNRVTHQIPESRLPDRPVDGVGLACPDAVRAITLLRNE